MKVKLNRGMHVSDRSTNLSFVKSRRAFARRRLSASIIVCFPHATGCNMKNKSVEKLLVCVLENPLMSGFFECVLMLTY